jgi:predicted RNA binding protein YcfA (HicA-like mRNA interferase family)
VTDIPWGALRSLTAHEIISALINDGFSLHNQRGSHQRVTVTRTVAE